LSGRTKRDYRCAGNASMAKVSSPVAPPGVPPRAPRPGAGSWRRRAFAWGLALAALAFVATQVKIRDLCEDPSAPLAIKGTNAARVPVSRDSTGCTLRRPDGEVRLRLEECATLTCTERGLASTLQHARVGMLFGLCALYFVATFAWAARWRALLRLARVPITLLEAWRITLEAQAGGILLPGGIGGDALRIAFVAKKGASLPTVIAAVFLDRATGLVTLAGLAALFSLTTFHGGPVPALLLVCAGIPVAFVLGLLLLRWEPLGRLPFFVRGPLASLARPVLSYVGEPGAPRAILTGVAISLLVSGIQLATIRGFVVALGETPTTELWVYVGATMAFIAGAIPALPGGWGTSDLTFVYFFRKAGLDPSIALWSSLLYRLFWYSSGAVGAVLYLLRQHASAISPQPPPPNPVPDGAPAAASTSTSERSAPAVPSSNPDQGTTPPRNA
jgi:uncharacterized membrane protein YbhN (UPF0104 family)